MGASTFDTKARGKTPKQAFDAAVAQAKHDFGHAGYTGSIAEKRTFVVIAVPPGKDPATFADELLTNEDPRVDDKWGPAGCVALGPDEWLFFGWASE